MLCNGDNCIERYQVPMILMSASFPLNMMMAKLL